MRVDRPGEYFDAQQRPMTEREAGKRGFNIAYWRGQKRAQEITSSAKVHADRIRAQSAEHLKSPETKREERKLALRAEAAIATAKVEREHAKQVQAAADKALTSDLFPDGQISVPTE
jgi:hypothetical protein